MRAHSDSTHHTDLPSVSTDTRRLQYMPGSVGMERDLARAPLFAASATSPDELPGPVETGSLYGYAFTATAAGGWPTVRDLLVLTELIDRYVKAGCPDSRLVPMGARDLCRAAGFPSAGGRQFQQACACLMRLRSLTVRYVAPVAPDRVVAHVWGPVEEGFIASGPDGRGSVRISLHLAALVRMGRLVYLDREMLRELYRKDHYAARLWTFLESETLGHPFRYRLFPAPVGEPAEATMVPAIADLLSLSGWARRGRVKERIEQAARVVAEVDPRYRLSVERASKRTMWNLHVTKNEHPP